MRYLPFVFRFTLIALLLCTGAAPAAAQDPVKAAQEQAEEAKKQQAKAEEAAAKLDCEKPKTADKKALVDAVKKAQAAAQKARDLAVTAKKTADEAGKTLDRNPKSKQAQAAKDKADQTAKDTQAAADEAAAAAKAALDQAPGLAAADAIGKELDQADVKGNSKKPEAVDRLKKAAQKAAEANPCDPEEVKRVVRVELEDLKDEFKGNKELKDWIEKLGESLKTNQLISMPPGGADALVFTATGTGGTSGHIADLHVVNPTNAALTLAPTPCFIPSSGQYQPYIVPYIPIVTVAPHSTATIPLNGFCADIFRPSVPDGEPLPPVSSWVSADPAPGATANGQPLPTRTAPPATAAWEPAAANGWKPAGPSNGALVPTYPGTAIPIGHTIDVGKYPTEAAPLLLDAIARIADAYDRLQRGGTVHTPFSANPEKERESVIQQTFWMYAAELNGRPYKMDDFRKNTVGQYETVSGHALAKAPKEHKKQVEQGVTDFWNTFQAVGVEAKVLSAPMR